MKFDFLKKKCSEINKKAENSYFVEINVERDKNDVVAMVSCTWKPQSVIDAPSVCVSY